MNNNFFYLPILLLFLSTIMSAQEVILPFYNNGKWGFMNKRKEIIVCPNYEEAYPPIYGSNLSRIKMKGKYGFIDHNGKLVISAKYEAATDFNYGLSTVIKNGKQYKIQTNGKKFTGINYVCMTHSCLFSPYYDYDNIFTINSKQGMIYHYKNENDTLNENTILDSIPAIFDTIVPISNELVYFVKDSLMAILHKTDLVTSAEQVLSNLIFKYEGIEFFPCNICIDNKSEIFGVKINGKWGYLRHWQISDQIIKPKYLGISSIATGYAKVEYEKNKFGYIDLYGNEYFIR